VSREDCRVKIDMPNNQQSQTSMNDEDLLRLSSTDIPKTNALQSRILQQTSAMTQLDVEPAVDVSALNVTFLSQVLKRSKPIALAASIALFAILTVPVLIDRDGQSPANDLRFAQDSNVEQPNVLTQSQAVDAADHNTLETDLTLEEIEFQEVVLLYNEWIFAQL